MKAKLTDKQKDALWGLIKYPSLNDRETADKIKMKLSTLTTIRYKMLNEGYYKTVNVPIVNRMDYELCAFFVIRMDPSWKDAPCTIRKNDFPNLVYIAYDQNRIMAYGFYPDYTTAENDLHGIVNRMTRKGSIAKSGHWYKFISLNTDDIPTYWEMSPFVKKGFDLKRSDSVNKTGSVFKGDNIHLSSFERRVLRELIALPDETDVQISKNLGITRSTVARIRQRLLGLAYKTLNIVDLTKVNYRAVSLAAPTMNFSWKGKRTDLRDAALSIEPPLFLSVGDYGAVYLTAHTELKGIRNTSNKVFRSGDFKGYVQDPTHIATFNLKQLEVVRNHEYLPLVEEVLDQYEYRPKRRKKGGKKKKKKK